MIRRTGGGSGGSANKAPHKAAYLNDFRQQLVNLIFVVLRHPKVSAGNCKAGVFIDLHDNGG